MNIMLGVCCVAVLHSAHPQDAAIGAARGLPAMTPVFVRATERADVEYVCALPGGAVAITRNAILAVRGEDGAPVEGTKLQRFDAATRAPKAERLAGGYVLELRPRLEHDAEFVVRGGARPTTTYRRATGPNAQPRLLDARTDVRMFALADGVEIVVRSGAELAYDVIDRSGGTRTRVDFDCAGATGIALNPDATLAIETPFGTLRQAAPIAFVEASPGDRQPARSWFEVTSETSYALCWARPEACSAAPIVIDPTLDFSTYLGGGGHESCEAVAVDASSNVAYVVGATSSTASSFPVTSGAFDVTYAGGALDAYVASYDLTTLAIGFVTYLGGSSFDIAFDVDVEEGDWPVIVGATLSSDFPTVSYAYDTTYNGTTAPTGDAFAAKIDSTGASLEFGTYLGAQFDDAAIAVDVVDGKIWVGGVTQSNLNVSRVSPFPTTSDAYQSAFLGDASTDSHAFMTKLTSRGTLVLYSTLLGGNDQEGVTDLVATTDAFITVSLSSNSYTGLTAMGPMPYLYNSGGDDLYLAQLDTTQSGTSQLFYAAHFGGLQNEGPTELVVEPGGTVVVTGETASGNFPLQNAWYGTLNGASDAYVMRIDPSNPSSPVLFSTYLGGRSTDIGAALAQDASGDLHLVGTTASNNFPIVSGTAYQTSLAGGTDLFILRMTSASVPVLTECTYLGGGQLDFAQGVAVVATGQVALCGTTKSTAFPSANATQSTATIPSGASPYPTVLGEGVVAVYSH